MNVRFAFVASALFTGPADAQIVSFREAGFAAGSPPKYTPQGRVA